MIYQAKRFDQSRPLFKELKALNFYQIKMIRALKFFHKTNYEINSQILLYQLHDVDRYLLNWGTSLNDLKQFKNDLILLKSI